MVSLASYRWHTGAELRRVPDDEPLPLLVRDVGPVALARFLRGTLQRLAGPMTPLLYLRTTTWTEPYTDHAGTGRLLFLDSRTMEVWESGVPGVYVCAADARPKDNSCVVYLPHGVDVDQARAGTPADRWTHDLHALDALNAECERVEALARPLRRFYQCGNEEVRALMSACSVDERDLCTPFHHLEDARRTTLHARLVELSARFEATT